MALRNAFDNIATESTGEKMVTLLGLILNRLSFPTTAGETRAVVNSGTVSTVTTMTQVGFGVRLDLDQMAQVNSRVAGLRSQIAVS